MIEFLRLLAAALTNAVTRHRDLRPTHVVTVHLPAVTYEWPFHSYDTARRVYDLMTRTSGEGDVHLTERHGLLFDTLTTVTITGGNDDDRVVFRITGKQFACRYMTHRYWC